MGRSSQNIYLSLKEEILAKRLRPGQYLPAIRELSLTYDVASGTAHKALKKLAKEGFIVSESRKGFRVANISDLFLDGLVIAYAQVKTSVTINEDLHFKQFKESLDIAAGRRGISILSLECATNNLQAFIDRLQICRIGGVILNTITFEKKQHDHLFTAFREMHLPVVLMDSAIEDFEIDTIHQDNFKGGLLAADYACKKGFKNFIWLGPAGLSHHSRERFGGVCAGLIKHGLLLQEKNILQLENKTHEDVNLLKETLKNALLERNTPTFVFSLWSSFAYLTSQVFYENKLKIGSDYGFIGWSIDELFDTAYKNTFNPKFIPPVVAWKSTELADQTIDRLLYRRKYPEAPASRSLIPVYIYK